MSDTFKSTLTAPTRCPRCHAPTLTALDEGIPARVNATPLPNRQAEIDALIQGLMTYTHTNNRHLVYRTPERITANTLRGTIHAEHHCNGPTQLTFDDLVKESQ
ncbi:hypothetical protein [Micromonospora tarensis]|uniref:Uncharacterized protein n=1 Tax=Micromonospora tarensis TaxID=2806100 RepID=A0ABS1Y9N4_9ACTN|nr:hypothetical protein [Micromonospora tarensis]MBM0274121.1 hypothetical protein [Micromonospora tarensis]